MPPFRVDLSHQANLDFVQILGWLEKRSLQGAKNWLDAFEQVEIRLSEAPLSFPLAEEGDIFPELVRQILFRTRKGNTYRALFAVRGEEVKILCIRGPGQPPVTLHDLRNEQFA